jgi:hypothetical protein
MSRDPVSLTAHFQLFTKVSSDIIPGERSLRWEPIMSQVYNPESDIIAEIERLELEARAVRRSVEHARTEQDKRVLNRQLHELQDQIEHLKSRLP